MKNNVNEIFNLIHQLQYEDGQVNLDKVMNIESMINGLSLQEKNELLHKIGELLSSDNSLYSKHILISFYESIHGRICVEEKMKEINNLKK